MAISRKSTFFRNWLLLFELSLFINQNIAAQETVSIEHAKTNLEIIQTLISDATKIFIAEGRLSSPDSIELKCPEYSDVWIIRNTVSSTLMNLGYTVYNGDEPSFKINYLFDVNNCDIQVKYDSMFRTSIFGEKKIKRCLSVNLAIRIINKENKILLSKSLTESIADTVAVADISKLELASSKSTHGEIPEDKFFSSIIEPFIIIGATGVAIFLFFNLRTK